MMTMMMKARPRRSSRSARRSWWDASGTWRRSSRCRAPAMKKCCCAGRAPGPLRGGRSLGSREALRGPLVAPVGSAGAGRDAAALAAGRAATGRAGAARHALADAR